MFLWPSNSTHKNMNLNIHPLSKYLVSISYVPVSILGAGDQRCTGKCGEICQRMRVCHARKLSGLCTNGIGIRKPNFSSAFVAKLMR